MREMVLRCKPVCRARSAREIGWLVRMASSTTLLLISRAVSELATSSYSCAAVPRIARCFIFIPTVEQTIVMNPMLVKSSLLIFLLLYDATEVWVYASRLSRHSGPVLPSILTQSSSLGTNAATEQSLAFSVQYKTSKRNQPLRDLQNAEDSSSRLAIRVTVLLIQKRLGKCLNVGLQ